MTADEHEWWQRSVIYQVYPRSFQDSTGDGVGDLAGIMSRLDYLAALGVDAIWISPIYPSPMADFGYDVADFTAIDPVFGSLADFDRLIGAAHARGLRVILDYVGNHSSDQHPWFLESRSSRMDPKRDWYIWRDPGPGGEPPTNWLSEFGGGAWTLDCATGQYYYHAYLPQQPDLNWRNLDLRDAMLSVLGFWLERGVDGFRVDAIHHFIKDALFRNNPPNPDWQVGMSPARRVIRTHTADLPEVHDAVAAMRRVTDRFPGARVLIGEAYLPIDRLMAYYGVNLSGFHLPFNFHLLSTPWNAQAIAGLVEAYEAALPPGAWPNWVLGNHDRSRVASRLGAAQARVAAMLLLTLRGTPTLYQGDEIGMTDVPIAPERVQDPWEKNVPGLGLGRDPVRTPMQWDASANAGFTTAAEPWLPIGLAHETANVEAQEHDPRSILSLHRVLIALRRAEPALSVGSYRTVAAEGDVLAYVRQDERTGRRMLVALNLGGQPQAVPLKDLPPGRVRVSTGCERAEERVGSVLHLGAAEGVVVDVTPA